MSVSDRYDRILSSRPVNTQAAKALSSRGVEGMTPPKVAAEQLHSDVPLPTVSPPPGVNNRLGSAKGKLRVYGYHSRHPKHGSRWVVRCVCGKYEVRHSKALDNPANSEDCCQECRKLVAVKRSAAKQAYFDRTGRWPADHLRLPGEA